jgi:hypothetical protein
MPALHLREKPFHACREPLYRQGVAEGDQETVRVQGLLQEVVRSLPGGLHRRVDGPMAADHHNQGVGVRRPQTLQDLQPVHPGHLHVQEDDVRGEHPPP